MTAPRGAEEAPRGARADAIMMLAPETVVRDLTRSRGLPIALTNAARCNPRPQASLAVVLASRYGQAIAAVLMALNAELLLVTARGARRAAADDRLTIDGRLLPRPDERLAGIALPERTERTAYAEAPGSAGPGLAAVLRLAAPDRRYEGDEDRNPRIRDASFVWWGLAAAPFRAPQLAAVLRGRRPSAHLIGLAEQTARTEATPAGAGTEISDQRLDAAAGLCRRLLTSLLTAS